MLKNRLLSAIIMTAIFIGLVLLDGFLDGSLHGGRAVLPVKGIIIFALLVVIAVPAQLELSKLIKRTGAAFFTPVVIAGTVLLCTSWLWPQLWIFFVDSEVRIPRVTNVWLALVVFGSLISVFWWQSSHYKTEKVIFNCGANFFAIFYLGFLGSFVGAVRVDYGIWGLMLFVMTVKFADIGAYTFGKLYGKTKFAPSISPAKSWEGMLGAVIFAAIVSSVISTLCGIMSIWCSLAFGILFAFIGQCSDLAESMLKRDAEIKDSAESVPGFGGLLDVLDSILFAAPPAYAFLSLFAGK